MKTISEFGVENFLITPAAHAVNEPAPATIQEQKWHLTVSGVAIADIKSTVHQEWSIPEDLILLSSIIDRPLEFALEYFSIPIPEDSPYLVRGNKPGIVPYFQVEQYTIVAALGCIFDQNTAVNAGFAVDGWDKVEFLQLEGDGNAPLLTNIFQGIRIVVNVRDIDAWLHKVNYQINLLGKIVFVRSI